MDKSGAQAKGDLIWETITEGIKATRITITDGPPLEVMAMSRDIIWVTCTEGKARCLEFANKSEKVLGQGDSSLFLQPGSAWKILLAKAGSAKLSTVAVFNITFAALHNLLAVEFHETEGAGDVSNIDYRKLLRTVHFGPSRIRDLGRIFIHAHDSRFKNMARKGVFYDVFAEMLEMLYGTDMTQCPFHIDAETERRIRRARQILVSNLQKTPDLAEISVEVELPRPVLKEGFQYVYGNSMQDYLSDYKFERAQVMLESGKYLIKEVAFEVGYQNPSHFISSFKQRYGMTPKQWLKQHAG